jgi:histidinol phosphatase-like enzyme
VSEFKSKTIVIDIDGTICSQNGANYAEAQPYTRVILAINKSFEMGHRIVLFTARGSTTGIDWTELTTAQLKLWKVKYSELRLGKPFGDYYVDDKNLSISEFLDKMEKLDA